MLTAEIKINGCLIAHVYAVNKGIVPGFHNKGDCNYDIEVIEIGQSDTPLFRTQITHKRQEGATVLIEKILKVYNQK